MAWYIWLAVGLGALVFIAQVAVDLLLVLAVGHLHNRIEAAIKSLFAVAKNVDERFAGDEKNIAGIAQFIVKAFGLDVLQAEPPKSGTVVPPADLKN